ncbi:MAG: hypothetical protein ACHQ1H_02630 [Nitrososphaerales archaeon]
MSERLRWTRTKMKRMLSFIFPKKWTPRSPIAIATRSKPVSNLKSKLSLEVAIGCDIACLYVTASEIEVASANASAAVMACAVWRVSVIDQNVAPP